MAQFRNCFSWTDDPTKASDSSILHGISRKVNFLLKIYSIQYKNFTLTSQWFTHHSRSWLWAGLLLTRFILVALAANPQIMIQNKYSMMENQ